MPGCTRGPHNPVKPAEPPKYVPPPDVETAQKTRKPVPKMKTRPCFDSPMITLVPAVADSLKKVLTNVYFFCGMMKLHFFYVYRYDE